MATTRKTSTTTPARSHSRKPKADETIPGDDAPKAAVQAAAGTEYASPTVQSPEGDTVTVASGSESFVVRKRTDLPVYEVSPVGWEGPTPLTVPASKWADFQKVVAGAD